MEPKFEFEFGQTTVHILQGDILNPGVKVDAVASTDDNYLTMASGISAALRRRAGNDEYVRKAQEHTPVRAGEVVDTDAYGLQETLGALKVLHGTVIDYDSDAEDPGALVQRTTIECLRRAEELGLNSILLPAFGTGAGGLEMSDCAERMCRAIKTYLAQERLLKHIYIILRPGKQADAEERVLGFIRRANLILDTPYDPRDRVIQSRTVYAMDDALQQLEAVASGSCDQDGKCHAVILGGPRMGKATLLDRLYRRQFEPDSQLGHGRRLVRLGFGNVHSNTPLTFVYRKLLAAILEEEKATRTADSALVNDLRAVYAKDTINRDVFLQFLADHSERYPEVVFLVNKLPALLDMEGPQDAERGRAEDPNNARQFWADLDTLQSRVRFIYTARDDEEYQRLRKDRLDTMTQSFKDRTLESRIQCVTAEQLKDCVDQIFDQYLGTEGDGAPDWAHDFFEKEAGRHPYLISLLAASLVYRVKCELLERPDLTLDDLDWERCLHDVRQDVRPTRKEFFRELLAAAQKSEHWNELRPDLESLALATLSEGRQAQGDLSQTLATGANWRTLQEGNPRSSLHDGPGSALEWLQQRGLVVDGDDKEKAQFMSPTFADSVIRALLERRTDKPDDVTISMLCPQRGVIRTIFQGQGARAVTADKPLSDTDEKEFLKDFVALIGDRLYGTETSGFQDIEDVSRHILTQFTDMTVKRYLQNAPERSTVLFMIDDDYKHLPWELMLESAYSGEIPFQVGRTIISQQAPQNLRPAVRGNQRVRALLIGDPRDDLDQARSEVETLASRLERADGFDFRRERDLLLGKEECRRIRILNALSSGEYGIVHYSGHTKFQKDQSAWYVADGTIPTYALTNALQMAPPALVFSSSCESASAAAGQRLRYEDQAFDLPGAFVQAGVEAYIGSLWPVESEAARDFTLDFYAAFLSGGNSIGECLRQARWACKQREARDGKINWLAFVLYGDPRVMPGDLFPVMKPPEA